MCQSDRFKFVNFNCRNYQNKSIYLTTSSQSHWIEITGAGIWVRLSPDMTNWGYETFRFNSNHLFMLVTHHSWSWPPFVIGAPTFTMFELIHGSNYASYTVRDGSTQCHVGNPWTAGCSYPCQLSLLSVIPWISGYERYIMAYVANTKKKRS